MKTKVTPEDCGARDCEIAKMAALLWPVFRWCCRCCVPDDTDNSTPPTRQVQQTISSTMKQVPEVKCPPERRSSIPLHMKRLEAAQSMTSDERRAAYQPISSDIEEEFDDDDVDTMML